MSTVSPIWVRWGMSPFQVHSHQTSAGRALQALTGTASKFINTKGLQRPGRVKLSRCQVR